MNTSFYFTYSRYAHLVCWYGGLTMCYLEGDDYTIRLWEAEAKLESLGYRRGCDGRWRNDPTEDDLNAMAEIKTLAKERLWHVGRPDGRT